MSALARIPMKLAAAPLRTKTPAPFGTLQRKCGCGGSKGSSGECPECKKKKTLQRQATSGAQTGVAPPIVHDVLRSPGQPLDARTRAFMEPRFGHDFSKVRIHTDARASDSAKAVNALAYTVGHDVVFAAGRHEPGTPGGRKLLAHELTHVVQQDGLSGSSILRVGGVEDPHERDADAEAARLMTDSSTAAPSSGQEATVVLRRQGPAPAPGVNPPSPPPPGPASSRIYVGDTTVGAVVAAVPGFLQGAVKHIFIVYHDGSTGKEFAWRGGNTAGKPVCPGVGLPTPSSKAQAVLQGVCPFNDPSLGAIGVGPLRAPFDSSFGDWPAINTRTLMQGPSADAVGSGTCFAAEAARISAACIPYSPCGPNSNSVAYTLLKNCGVSPTGPPGLAYYPGWGTLI